MSKGRKILLGAVAAGLMAMGSVGAKADVNEYKEFESKFWNETLPKASGGKLTANIKPQTELGLKGYEIMSGLKKGAYDAVHALTSYSAKASPAPEGIDLAGVIQDYST